MDPYQAAAVWKRVRQSTSGSSSEHTLADTLSAAIAREIQSEKTYLAMSRLGYAPLFRQLATQEGCHARHLSALYYLLYGYHPEKTEAQCPIIRDLREGVRSAFLQELEAAKGYRALAQSEPQHAEVFCALAKDEEGHAARLRCLTERLLGTK